MEVNPKAIYALVREAVGEAMRVAGYEERRRTVDEMRLLGKTEVAAILGFSEKTIMNMVEMGELGMRQIRGEWRTTREQLQRDIERLMNPHVLR